MAFVRAFFGEKTHVLYLQDTHHYRHIELFVTLDSAIPSNSRISSTAVFRT